MFKKTVVSPTVFLRLTVKLQFVCLLNIFRYRNFITYVTLSKYLTKRGGTYNRRTKKKGDEERWKPKRADVETARRFWIWIKL